MRNLIAAKARANGVSPALALAISYQESGWNQGAVSVANAVGAMQVIPATTDWISGVVGRRLDPLSARRQRPPPESCCCAS
jgi:soluble lytic murein transglycosylase-like protein